MKLTPDKLTGHIAKGLQTIYVISSDEPLLAGEVADTLRAAARESGYTERESHTVASANRFDWSAVSADMGSLSLFSERKIVEVRIPTGKPGREGGATLTELALEPVEDVLLVIHLPHLTQQAQKAKWASALAKAGVWISVPKISSEQLPRWLQSRASVQGLTLEPDALNLLANRTEGNLLAAQQELDKLRLLIEGDVITADDIARSVADGARFDVYQLADAAVGQNAGRALRILLGLKREGIAPQLVSWALARESSALLTLWQEIERGGQPAGVMQKLRIWQQRQSLYNKALSAHDEASLRRLMDGAGKTDRIVKGARRGSAWQALVEMVFLLARPQQPLAGGLQ